MKFADTSKLRTFTLGLSSLRIETYDGHAQKSLNWVLIMGRTNKGK